MLAESVTLHWNLRHSGDFRPFLLTSVTTVSVVSNVDEVTIKTVQYSQRALNLEASYSINKSRYNKSFATGT